MSKAIAEREPVIIDVLNNELLKDLNVPKLMEDQKKYITVATAMKEKADNCRAELQVALNAVHADKITYTDEQGGQWSTALVPADTSYEIDEVKLREAMSKIGGLTAPLIASIFKASRVSKTRAAYVKVHVSRPKTK